MKKYKSGDQISVLVPALLDLWQIIASLGLGLLR